MNPYRSVQPEVASGLKMLSLEFFMKNGPYELVVAPEGYPGKKYRGRYAYEHHVVFWKKHGIVPKKGEVVHHKDENKRNNHPDNLELKTNSKHASEHHKPAVMTETVCRNCGRTFGLTLRGFKARMKASPEGIFCGRSCQVSHQQMFRIR